MFYPLNTILINKEEYITLPTSSEDNRHGAIKRYHFDNDWVASIAQHTGVNGGDMELFSVALMNSDGKVFTSPNDPTSRWQDIKENLTYSEVETLIEILESYNDTKIFQEDLTKVLCKQIQSLFERKEVFIELKGEHLGIMITTRYSYPETRF